MANWINGSANESKSSQQRKRWELEDKKLLKNLRYQLAEDGNSECQYELAKQLLEDADDHDSSRQVQGISYLKKAAEQGHEMALELLGACYRTRRGITESNEAEVRKFLEMTPAERCARRAARELFNSLCNGNEYVTVEQLEKRMREIYKLQKRKKKKLTSNGEYVDGNDEALIKNNGELDGGCSSSSSPLRVQASRRVQLDEDDNHISESNLISAAKNYSHGVIPFLNQALTLSAPHPLSLEHVPFLHRPFFHPSMFFSLLYHRFIEILSSFPTESLKKYQIIFALMVYALVSSNNLLISLPTFGYYITIAIMVVSTFKMLKSKHEFIDFRIWSGLFLSYNENVYADDSENLFIRNNLKPYFWFFLAFAINLTIYPLIADQWLPNSEITVISFVLIFATMFCFMHTTSRIPDLTILCSFASNVLAKYPYEMDSVVSSKWRFLDLKIPGIPSFMIGSGVEFTMNCRGMLYLAILFFMLILAKRRSWTGIYQFLFPHCVTLSWLQICIISSQSATTFGLIRSALGLAGVFFILPIFGIATLLIPVLAAVEWLSVADSTKRILITISTSLVAIIASCFMAVSNRTGKYVTYFHIFICILASCFLFRPYMMMEESNNFYTSYLQEAAAVKGISHSNENIMDSMDDSVALNWNMYYNYCLQPSSNIISTQIRCSHLDGEKIYWDGSVADVRINKIINWRRDIFQNYLPEFISNFITCYFGEDNQSNCFEGENCEIRSFIEGQKRCNVDKWNIYEYEIDVKLSSSTASTGILNLNPRLESKITLKADNTFGNFTTKLNSSDKIWFKGTLRTIQNDDNLACKNDNHKLYTRIDVTSIGCLHCLDKTIKPIVNDRKLKVEKHLRDLQRGVKYLLNVLFNPLVTFK